MARYGRRSITNSSEFNRAAYRKAKLALFEATGTLVFEWNRIEDAMFHWFRHYTGFQELMARKVFYSNTNFNSRKDCFKGTLSAAKIAPIYKRALRTASQKAADYSQFRNAIVHGPVLFDNWADSKTHQQFLILQPKLPNAKSLKLAIPISKVHSGAECFRQLSKAMFECLNFYLDRQNIPRPIGEALSPAKFAQLVEKLPTLQHSKGHNRPKRAKRQLRGTP